MKDLQQLKDIIQDADKITPDRMSNRLLMFKRDENSDRWKQILLEPDNRLLIRWGDNVVNSKSLPSAERALAFYNDIVIN